MDIGDLVRCWELKNTRVIFSIGIIIKLEREKKSAKVCVQDTGELIEVDLRNMYLIKKNSQKLLDK